MKLGDPLIPGQKLHAVGMENFPNQLPALQAFSQEVLANLEGFVGVYPMPPYAMLLLFDTDSSANNARKVLSARGIKVGAENILNVQVGVDGAPELTNPT